MTVSTQAYEQDNQYRVGPSYADYSSNQFCAMYLGTDGRITICTKASKMWGLLQDKPAAQDEQCTVRVRGVGKAVLGYAVNAGDLLQTWDAGTLGPWTTPNPIVGMALRAGSTNDIIPVDLDARGGPSTGVAAAPPGVMEFRIPLAAITSAKDLKTGIVVPSAGTIIDMQVDVEVVDNLSSIAATLYLKNSRTGAVTGAEVAITSATLTPVLTTIASTGAASAKNTFLSSDTLTISAKSLTSNFGGSTGWITVRVLTSA